MYKGIINSWHVVIFVHLKAVMCEHCKAVLFISGYKIKVKMDMYLFELLKLYGQNM